MRTTLTIDDDVAIALERIRERDELTLKTAVNEALRRGLRVMDAEAAAATAVRYELPTWNSGGMRISVESVAEAVAWAEGEEWK
jgi:hypothetical protein